MLEAIILAGTPKSRNRLIQGKNKFFAKLNNNYLGNLVVNVFIECSMINSIYIIPEKIY